MTQRAPLPTSWHDQVLTIGGHSIRLRLPSRPEEVLARVAQADVSAQSDPYWGYLWPTAEVMAALVLETRWRQGTTTLELGCGSGLVGIAGLISGLDVTFSDLVPDAVNLSQLNARINGFMNPKALVLDWRHPMSLKFHVLLASDVLYQPTLHASLIRVIDNMLDRDGVCWIADPGRTVAREFIQQLGNSGLNYQLHNADGDPVLMPCFGRFCLITIRHAIRNS